MYGIIRWTPGKSQYDAMKDELGKKRKQKEVFANDNSRTLPVV